MRRDTRLSRGALIGASAFVATVCWSQSLTWLGVLPGGNYSRANAVSADGTVVVGVSNSSSGTRAFRWTRETGMVELGPGESLGVSADGNVIVGYAYDSNNLEYAFRWTPTTGFQPLVAGSSQSVASGVSRTGQSLQAGRLAWACSSGLPTRALCR
jgi:probable HAF family extracellular repeat protein